MLTQSEAERILKRLMFLEKDRARLADRVKKLEDRIEALQPPAKTAGG